MVRLSQFFFWLVAVFTFPAFVQAQIASLVKDINTTYPSEPSASQPSSSPGQLTSVGNKVFFFATEPSSGRELWVTDGTAVGTELMRDIEPGPVGSDHPWVGSARQLFFWVAPSASGKTGLWRSDGTRSGTFEVFPRSADLEVQSSYPEGVTIAGDRVFFRGCSGGDCHLWRSDGTVGGTSTVPGEPGGLFASALIPVGNRVFFFRLRDLWVSDGAAAGTHLVQAMSPRDPSRPTAAGNHLFFLAAAGPDQQIWVSDGTKAGTLQVTQFTQAYPFGPGTFLRASGSGIFFSTRDETHLELWSSDGSRAGTKRLADVAADQPFGGALLSDSLFAAASHPVFFVTIGGQKHAWTAAGGQAIPLSTACVSYGGLQWNGKVFFVADDGIHGQEPWVTDGTPQGTRQVADLCPGSCGSEPFAFVARSSAVYFASGVDIWRTDGTAAGIQRLTDASFQIALTGAAAPFDIAETGRNLFVSSRTPYGNELWMRDGTGHNRLVTDIARNEPSAAPRDLTRLGDRLLFTADDGNGRTLWQSSSAADVVTSISGSFQGTLDIPTGWGLTAGDAVAYYFFPDADGLLQLWRTDGTAAGTVQVLKIPQGVAASNRLPPGIGTRALFRGKVLFAVSREDLSALDLWESDGTAAGTRPASFMPASVTSFSYLQTVDHEIYFSAFGEGGPGLWRSDGTLAGTRKIAAVGAEQNPQFSRLGNAVFFIARGPNDTWHLWKTDGTPEGTSNFLDTGKPVDPVNGVAIELSMFQGHLYLFLRSSTGDDVLWRSDGTPAGTAVLRSFSPAVNGSAFSHSPVGFAGRLFFVMEDVEHGIELWSTDGTPKGTTLFKDIAPGPASSAPAWLTAGGDRLFFTAHDGEHGIELWQTDGTAAGTRMMEDLAPEALSSSPDQLTAVGDRLFFTADDGLFGRELWSLALNGTGGCVPSTSRLCLGGGRYQVEAAWRTAQNQTGTGTAAQLSADTGYFWFFSPANVETIVKVLDGKGVNGHVWVFYGALSNVEYTLTVTDTQTGLARRYFNPLGQLASVGDTHAFGPLGANGANPRPPATTAAPSPLPLIAERRGKAATAPCQPGAQRLCLNGNRFAVDVAWKDFQGHTGKGTTLPLSGDTGAFWFFDAANVELVVKALDGRPVNGHFWLFYGALSNVEYTLTVTDTQTGAIKTYTNPSGRFASVADTVAF